MINYEQYEKIQDRLDIFKYNSMKYTAFEEVETYDILHDSENIVLIYGYNKEMKLNQYHWACDQVETLINSMDSKKTNVLLTFVPKEWTSELQEAGFQMYAIWNDYFVDHIEIPSDEIEPAVPSYVKNSTILVKKINEDIVGVICVATYAHESEKGAMLWIREIAVHPQHQRKGIARELIKQAYQYGKMLEAKRAFLMVDECNEYAIHLYKSMGFVGHPDEAEINMIN